MSIVVNKTRLPVTKWQTASGSVVSIANARGRDAKSAVVTLQPIQDTSGGDPSPTNICPISGHGAVTLNHAGASQSDNPTSITVSLGQTVYGGSLDLVSGVLTADMVSQNITTCVNGAANYARYVIGEYGYIDPSVTYCNMLVKHNGTAGSLPEGTYRTLNSSGYNASQAIFCFAGCSGSSSSTTRSLNQEKLTELNNAGTPLQIVYKLATPITYQLTPTQIEMLMRNNTIWSDDGIVAVNYARIRS